MKTIFTLKKATAENYYMNIRGSLQSILFTLLLSTLTTKNGNQLLASSPELNVSVAKSESKSDDHPALFFQEKVDVVQPTIEWDKTFGGSDGDNLSRIISTLDGGYLLAGSSNSPASGDKSEDNKGDYDYWIVKVDDQGNKIWDKTFGGSDNDGLNDAISTPDGGYLLAGYSNSNASGDKSENRKGGCDEVEGCTVDYWIVKVDADGNKIWDKTFGGSDNDLLIDAISTPDGGYLLIGESNSDSSGDKSENNKGSGDIWIVKIDAQGKKVWDNTIGGNGEDYASSAILTPDGGYLLAGSSNSPVSGDKSENPKGGCNQYSCEYDYWIVKIDADGNKIWDKTLGGNDHENIPYAISTPDGGYLLAGYSNSNASGDKSEDSKGTWDYWVVKIDVDGNKEWDKTFGGSNSDWVSSIIPTPDGGYLLAGHSYSDASGDKSENSKGFKDYWIVKIDTDGNKVWDKTIGGEGLDDPTSAISTADGGYLLVGWSTSDASGDKSQNSKGGSDFWVVKIKEQIISVTPAVTSLSLIDAKTDQEISELNEGDVINLAEIGSARLNIRANTFPEMMDSVEFELNGPITHQQIEKVSPYALFGDYPTGNFKSRKWLPGNYTLTATPFFKNEEGTALTISFEVTDAFAITGFTLIDAKRNQAVGELSDGDVIDLASFNDHPLSIQADTKPLQIGKVIFALEGPVTHTQIEKEFPYALFGDYPTGNYKHMKWTPGNYTLIATPYALDSMGVPSTLTFTVIDSRSYSPEAESLRVEVYPVPTSDMINILHEGKTGEVVLMLLDFSGNILLHRPLSQQPLEQLDVSAFKKGIYYLKVVSPETVQVFRIVKE